MTARIQPASPPYSDVVVKTLAPVTPPGTEPIAVFRTLAVNERVLQRVMAGGLLDPGSIELRDREILIDRVCFRCGTDYEWGLHVLLFSARAGLSEDEIRDTCAADPDKTVFPPRDRLLLKLADEIHATTNVGDALWAELARVWKPEQLIELVVLAGYYRMMCLTVNALRVPTEVFTPRFPPNK